MSCVRFSVFFRSSFFCCGPHILTYCVASRFVRVILARWAMLIFSPFDGKCIVSHNIYVLGLLYSCALAVVVFGRWGVRLVCCGWRYGVAARFSSPQYLCSGFLFFTTVRHLRGPHHVSKQRRRGASIRPGPAAGPELDQRINKDRYGKQCILTHVGHNI